MKNELYDNSKESYVKPVCMVYELCLESTILQASLEGSTIDPDDDGEGNITFPILEVGTFNVL